MPRKPRMYLPGVPAHLVQRGNNRGACFFGDDDYRYYPERLGEGLRRFDIALHAYVLMTNHVHLLVTPRDSEGPSRLMQHLGRHYVLYVNRTYRRTGTLWEGRHKASLVQAEGKRGRHRLSSCLHSGMWGEINDDDPFCWHYIYAGGEQVGTFVTKTGTANQTRYFHRDHLGSVDVVTNDAGSVIERMSYDAWGKRRNADWTDATGPITVTSTLRGFTGHEQIDQVGLIHMNGRVYNPTLGRFVSADPFIQAPELSQSYNRYTYVLNNPLSLTDPTGYFFGFLKKLFKGIGNLFKNLFKAIFKNFRSLFMIGLSFIPAVGQGAAIALGFIGGVVASGGDLKAGIIGAITAAAFWQIGHGVIGQRLGTATSSHGFLDGIHLKKIIAHGAVGGASAELQGGKFYQGFLSAGTTQAFSPLIGEFKFKPIRVAISGGIGGTASVLGGGKFANGALTGAFSRLFNDEEPDHANESDDHFVLDFSVADLPSLPSYVVDGFVGFGDGAFRVFSFGFGDLPEIRNALGIDGGVNYDSASYQLGFLGGTVDAALPLVLRGGAFLGGNTQLFRFLNQGRYWRLGPSTIPTSVIRNGVNTRPFSYGPGRDIPMLRIGNSQPTWYNHIDLRILGR